ncbi:formyl transferase [Epibacterium sp. MM17-32]|uniref:formyl transferase n=1 Tax=Epibacterium sp. MM17-32 TaxID=2917734 RepID=UPI001EF5F1BE|nr:formyl transferase [Epibacterium sp. MM17-32]MCG7630331.1 formyl transferase [Epibacterium sp. MM17-32]
MKMVVITGDHPRHRYLATKLAECGLLSGWIIEKRKPFMPEAPAGLTPELTRLFNLHFQRREEAEERFFGQPTTPSDVPNLSVTPDTLNDQATLEFIKQADPRLVLSYGCHKLSDALIQASGCTFWNTHGGFSPQYRGVTTHFWPSYMLEPQMTGVTMHETTSHIDGGAIIHQNAALEMHADDGLHDLAARTVRAYADEIPALLAKTLEGDLPLGQPQKTSGKIWIGADWRPEHLHLIYNTYEDRICKAVADGELAGRIPTPFSLLKD